MKPFSHLHTHSHFSLLTAVPTIKELVNAAKEDNQKALALTDNGNLYGAIEFYETCLKNEIKPILGIDAYVASRTRHDKEGRIDTTRTRIVLLAKNLNGYKNLLKLVTLSHLEGFYYKPRIDRELIEKYSSDLICIMPFFNSELTNAIRIRNENKTSEILSFYKKVYDKNLYLEITHHPEMENAVDDKKLFIEFARKNNVQMVATHDVYYLKPEDHIVRETMTSIQSNFSMRESFDGDDANFSFISQKNANEYFSDLPEALENVEKIISECNLEIELGKWKFPDFPIESGLTSDEELRRLAYLGIEKRRLEKNPELEKRIEYELEIIKNKGYSKYFLTVADILNTAKERKILTNTRGSAAGSLVSYLVGITTVDPIKLELPFERFLNPERPSAPDVDMDFADDKRDEVIEYVREKYGHDKVAQIGTFGTMLAKGSVRDVARAMGYDYQTGEKIAKLIPLGSQGFPMTIDRALEEVSELAELYKKDVDTKTIIDMAKKIEGRARHIGVHAAGVVISPDPLIEDVPIQFDPKGEQKLITQYDMHAVGEDGVGLLKFDFLGLKNLTILGNTLRYVRAIFKKEIDIDKVSLDDNLTYEMLSRGETGAIFQLNGQGMTQFLKQLKPTNIYDINAMVALYRPGPMKFIPDYIERKHNPNKVKYLDERFKNILEKTFGILIYQDDIMLLAVNFAGYSWGEADKFRKAMGKKIPELMEEQEIKFKKGCQEIGGLSKKQADDLWNSIVTFAKYGFNKAHAASYGRVAYLTAYFKANFPIPYMAAVLTADSGDVEKVAIMVEECKRMNIEVLPPDINESFEDFTAVIPHDENNNPIESNVLEPRGQIRFGLTTIKNFGEGIAHEIIEERKRGGKFKNLEDFVSRIKSRNFNKKSLEALICSGALDSLGERGQLLYNLESLLKFNKEIQNEHQDQGNLFGGSDLAISHLKLEIAESASQKQKLAWEKELLGLYISGHPFHEVLEKMKQKGINADNVSIKKIKETALSNTSVLIAGHIDDIRVIQTKKGDEMAFVKISDLFDSIETVFFPKIYNTFKAAELTVGKCLLVKGKISDRGGDPSILVDKVKAI